MGWLISYQKLRHDETPDSYLRGLWAGMKGREIIASATVGNTWYAALRIEREGKPVEIAALVYLFSRGKPGEGFGYKSMDETMGPCEAECPARILDLLTPTEYEYAIAWRAQCRANLANKAKASLTRSAIKPGMRLKLSRPLTYGALQLDTFTVVPTPPRNRGIIATAEGGNGLYRVPTSAISTATIL